MQGKREADKEKEEKRNKEDKLSTKDTLFSRVQLQFLLNQFYIMYLRSVSFLNILSGRCLNFLGFLLPVTFHYTLRFFSSFFRENSIHHFLFIISEFICSPKLSKYPFSLFALFKLYFFSLCTREIILFLSLYFLNYTFSRFVFLELSFFSLCTL